jgi:predicted MFS family arabinose efflux permease
MAISTGVIVANIYYIQPLLADIARQFHLPVPTAGLIATLMQIGTACGMLCFVPLGDTHERRSLVSTLILCASAALVLLATARNVWWLGAGAFAVGLISATVHVIVPYAAQLAPPAQRGRVLGFVFSGLLFGILLARTFSGYVGAQFGWRAVFWIAAGAMLILAALIRTQLPVSVPELQLSWAALVRSATGLIRAHRGLREAALIGSLGFAAFSAFWTTLIFRLQAPPFHYGSTVAGLFGLVGAAGAAGAPVVGHLADRHGPRRAVLFALLTAVVSFVIMGVAGNTMVGLIIGVILLDLGIQASHVANQTRIYALDATARSRLNMVYMICYFLGGAAGSYCGSQAWHLAGWWGVCGFGIAALLPALALILRREPVR